MTFFFFFKQKTAYEMRISDWSSDGCSSDLELERVGRGAYTGAMGWLNRDGDLDLNILIRSAEVEGAQLRFRTGAGIVADSEPRHELDETRAKARGMLRALGL